MSSNIIAFPTATTATTITAALPEALEYEVQAAPTCFEPIPGAGYVSGIGFTNYRTDTEQPLGQVRERYQIVQNGVLFASLYGALQATAPARSLEGALVRGKTAYDGAQAFADIAFPNLTEDLAQARGNSTAITFRLLLWNSFDGSSPVRVAAGAIDGFCSNGMIFGSYDVFGKRHTKGFRQEDLTKFVGDSFGLFQRRMADLRRETFAPIQVKQAEEFLKANFSERRAAALLDQFGLEAAERGQTVWALRSALTYYASHDSERFGVRNTGADSQAAVLYGRENEVASILASRGWSDLLAA